MTFAFCPLIFFFCSRAIPACVPIFPQVLADREGLEVAQLVEQWQRGRFSYQVACARCHGEDGNSEDYPNIKKLRGIGKRISRDEIRNRLRALTITRDEISIRSHLFSRRDLEALLVYVAGL